MTNQMVRLPEKFLFSIVVFALRRNTRMLTENGLGFMVFNVIRRISNRFNVSHQ